MRTHKYMPQWRLRDATRSALAAQAAHVELVEQPDKEWFTGKEHVRFALMSDGHLFFGDGMHVLHQDICQARGKVTSPWDTPTRPIVVGVLMKQEGVWRFANSQEFMRGTTEDTLTNTRYLLAALKDWDGVVEAMGNDPVPLPAIGS